nr:MAG TPA: hypothetical protein [Caudoviricetes sp.]
MQTWNYLIRLSQELQLASVLPRLQTRCGRTDTDCECYPKGFTQQTDSTFYALYP